MRVTAAWVLVSAIASAPGLAVPLEWHGAIENVSSAPGGADRVPQITASGLVAWHGWDGNDYEIWRSDGGGKTNISNNDGRMSRMVEHQGWQEYFDHLVDSEEVASTKPDPGIFRHALCELELEPDEIVHIGDYYSADVVGARRAGIEGILYDPLEAYAEQEVDCRVITTLLESVELL